MIKKPESARQLVSLQYLRAVAALLVCLEPDLVTQVASLAREVGRRIATPGEAAAVLAIPPR